ncbi:hypothetical protein BBO_04229 [Beauveria brongniartii RCEF 3172]|uniref:Uncharacterized protein n=1 Tax=Beauveria brongniartii RCEF 3172 TaxID=1081107 RepID=A0A162JLS6_9HYPO|nr:hypothetical protein BBO_04229 [Beauveria brongniartii RCEF 3172]
MRYTAVLLTFSSVAFAAPMESGATIAMRQQAGGILSGLTNLLGGQGAPNNGTTGGILSGLTGLLGNPGSQNAPSSGGAGGILSGLTRILGNPGSASGQGTTSNGSQRPANGNPTAPSSGAAGGGSIMSGMTSLLSNLGSHLPGNGDQYPPNSGGTGGLMADLQVLPDHMKFVTNPSTAEQPIPKEQNSQMREGHRIVHVAINKGLGVADAKNSTDN